MTLFLLYVTLCICLAARYHDCVSRLRPLLAARQQTGTGAKASQRSRNPKLSTIALRQAIRIRLVSAVLDAWVDLVCCVSPWRRHDRKRTGNSSQRVILMTLLKILIVWLQTPVVSVLSRFLNGLTIICRCTAYRTLCTRLCMF